MRREFALAGRLSRDWAALPLRLGALGNGEALVLEDPGGDPASPATTGPLLLARFLRIAANAAEALRHMHGNGLIHRDIQPSHLLIDSDDRVHLTGFGIACDLPRVRQDAAPPALIDGTLAYMAPEQTGRINRLIDARTDLYALGVTFYELLSGRLPFTAQDPLEWFHCHVARPPAPLPTSVTTAAPAVAAIILKLLAKAPEERYQTAGGLEADLRRCIGMGTPLLPFPLGQADVPDQIVPPGCLYGRERELKALSAALRGLTERGEQRMLLVSGPPGIGKSALVEELRAALVPVRGVLAAAKCDQYRRDIPYAALTDIVRDLVGRILVVPEPRKLGWRDRIRKAVGRNGRVLTNLAPALTRLIGEQPALPALPSADEARRFQRIVVGFLALFARPQHPLVLFLDDLQWLDRESFGLLEALIGDLPDHMLLVGTYRDAEVPPDHPLHGMVAATRQAGIVVDQLFLGPLNADDMARLVADTLHHEPEAVRPLSDAIAARTGGNPFFAGQFMTGLAEEGLLRFDHAALRWHWDLDGILRKPATENVVALMAERLVRVSEGDRALLLTLACLGGAVSADRLGLAHGVDRRAVQDGLRAPIAAGLVVHGAGTYGFAHDRIQEAAYAALPKEERAARHLRIARHLASALGPEEANSAVPPVVDQYNRATGLIVDMAERERVAALNLRAGRHARASTAYEVASGYFEAGLNLLGRDGGPRGRLGFGLSLGAAECLFLRGDQTTAERRLLALLPQAEGVEERAAVAALLITLHTAQDRSDRAVEACLSFMQETGGQWRPHPGPEAARQEYAALQADLGGRPVESLSGLPRATSREAQAFMDVLAATLPPAFFTDQDLVCLILCRMARLSLANGNADASPLGYAYLGMMMGPYFGDYPAGFRFGRLGQEMVEAEPVPRYEPRVRMCFACHVAPWTWPFARTLPLLRRAHEIAVEVGDLTYSGFSACTFVTSLIAAGTSLGEVQAEAEAKLTYVRGIRFGLIADIITSQIGLLRALRGLPSDIADPAFEARLEAEPDLAIAACWHWIRRLQVAIYENDTPLALIAAQRAAPLLWTTDGHVEMAEYHFHAALARAAAEEASAPAAPSPELLRHQGQMRTWAESGPANFTARALLLDAAVATVRGDSLAAIQHVEAAIRAARESRLIQVEALAQEWAFRFYRRRDLPTAALAHLRGARSAYLAWGATAKVQRIDELIRELIEVGEPAVARHSPEGVTLDMESLVRSSQAVSGEAGLPALMQTLMVTVLEHAGATRGLLVLPRSGELRMVAEARAGSQGIEVTFPDASLTGATAPLSILDRTMEDREPVLIGDAARQHDLSTDPYLEAQPTRSLLCLPLLRQAKIMGLLYLENGLSPHAFTEARLAVLRLLASQAAISLGNAALEEKEALLKEMHHRVKNNLQLISSLLNLQASRIEDPQVAGLFADSRDRVRSMALVHENLYHAGDYTRVSMRRHLSSLCAQLRSAYRSQERDIAVVTELADLHLDLDKAVSCGLIVNELVSNAFKHAFAGRSAGEIRVTLDEEADGRARLSVSDDGNGFAGGKIPDPETADSLGLQLIGDLTHQLRGEIAMETGDGASLSVTFPLSPQAGEAARLH
jgi:predicted ATPase/two-component sensor histidine kinase